jgi:hypothetical protein
VRRLAPFGVLVTVTALLVAYGHAWSWLLGPLAALLLSALDRQARKPAAPAPAHAQRRREPAPVD